MNAASLLRSKLEASLSELLRPWTNVSSPSRTLLHFWRFNFVGLLGVLVQLLTLAVLNHATPYHYLLTSSAAVELTLLHNFGWHLRYTWPEPSGACNPKTLTRLLRFHISNGFVSVLGNLLLMRLLVRSFHAPILLANAATIAVLGLINFLLAHYWVFAAKSTPASHHYGVSSSVHGLPAPANHRTPRAG